MSLDGRIMDLVVTEYSHCKLIKISGRIDSYTAPRIKEALNSMIDDGQHNIIVDLQNVQYLSSSGILTFVDTQRQLKRQNTGELVFLNVPELVLLNFEIAGFDTIFDFYNDTAAALGRF